MAPLQPLVTPSARSLRRKNVQFAGRIRWRRRIRKERQPSGAQEGFIFQRSLGELQVMASTEWNVDQLVEAAVNQYLKEGRRLLLQSNDPSAFGLQCSLFNLQCLDPEEKLIESAGIQELLYLPKVLQLLRLRD